MDCRPSRVRSSHEGYPESLQRTPSKNDKDKKFPEKKTFFDNESFEIVRGISLVLSVLALCYYGSTEYNVLQNGQILRGYLSRKTVVTFRFGYPFLQSIISVVAVCMFIYSIVMKRPQFSLPFIGYFLAELVCDSCDVVIMTWYLIEYLRIQTALLYAAGLTLLILAEIWMWLGAVRLYEHRNFKTC